MSQTRPRWLLVCSALLTVCNALADQLAADPAKAFVKPGDNLVLENIPPIPLKVAEETGQYGESRPSVLLDWHPGKREILIGTRFADTAQVHAVSMPGGARRQLTFFPDRVRDARYLPDGRSFLFQKDIGGAEWFQIYRYDLASGAPTLLTDGHSRNETFLLAHHSTQLVFTSTQRNNKDDDLWIMDAASSANASARPLLRVDGGGWAPLAWSHDNRRLLVQEFISINESYLWLVDVATGEKKALTPKDPSAEPGATVAYSAATFSGDDKDIYVVTDRDSEFLRLARINLDSRRATYLTTSISWNVDDMTASEDGRWIAFATNESGFSKLYLLDTASDHFRQLGDIPSGVVTSLHFHPAGHDLGFVISSARSPADVYSVNVQSGNVDRWTEGETGGLNADTFIEPRLIRWKSFDALELSGFLYQPDSTRFPGKRPVIVSIHGGPESQFRPSYRAQDNYLLNELGVAIVAPNVRGSNGYGKTFLKLDNGFHRDDTYKDILALLDWIGTQPQLDADRVMVTG
jgi:dipeptidyl aminopeptidase/acylaminoacyl peptidase